MDIVRRWFLLSSVLASMLVCAPAIAQDFPHKPLRVVVGYPAGGVNDILARLIAQSLETVLGQPVVVENRPGANGIIGGEFVAKAAADGYTLFFTGTPFAINASLYPKLPYDTLRDFSAVSQVSTGTFLLVVNPLVPAKSARELIDLARQTPGKINFCSSGLGAPSHLMGELLKQTAQVNMVHVPYKGVAPCMTDLMGGQVQVAFEAMAPLLPHIRSGKLRALAVMGDKRSPILPDLPTIYEATGYSGLTSATWYAVLAPANTPPSVIMKLNVALADVLRMPQVKEKLASQGLDPATSSPEQLTALLRDEVTKWARVVETAGAKVE